VIEEMHQREFASSPCPQLIQRWNHPSQHERVIPRVVRPSDLHVESLSQKLQLHAAVDQRLRQRQRVVEDQLFQAVEALADPPEDWNIELLTVVGDENIGADELTEAAPHLGHRRCVGHVLVGVAVDRGCPG
jgi:hypothetical protein